MVEKIISSLCIAVGITLSGCSGPGYDFTGTTANSLLVQGAVDSANIALSHMDCGTAYGAVYSLYDSTNTNNDVRSAMAATYGCFATVNVLNIVEDMLNFAGNLGGAGFWSFLAQEFPSSANDKIPQSAEYGTDALMSVLNPATILVPADVINSTSNNPGSVLYTDRTGASNSLLVFISMSLMGSLENRYGLPSPNYDKSQPLPWTSATETQGDGCAFASGLLNFMDGINFISTNASQNVAAIYSKIQTFLDTSINAACQIGCLICGGSVSCTTCPLTLRSRASCTGLSTDVNSCAASGIATFVNSSWPGPP